MKRTVLAMLLTLVCAGASLRAADLLILSAGASYIRHADAFYRATYGNGSVQPEVELGVRVFRGLYVMGAYGGGIRASGRIHEFDFDARSTQSYLAAGLGYIATLRGILKFKLEAGLADVMYTEEALNTRNSGSRLGYQAEAALLVAGKAVFAGIQAGYIAASETIGDVKFKLGGTRFGLLAGIRL